ncbi:hypothetical protein AB0J63_21960 [Streptosporangium canum]|uniref:hypothetical protein n=1 Tax=Streptosporangium canum TaxID=324952 RepID=UPI0034290D28
MTTHETPGLAVRLRRTLAVRLRRTLADRLARTGSLRDPAWRDAVEVAVLTWQAAGSPHQSAYGLTVTGERQYVWLGESDGPSWDLPV